MFKSLFAGAALAVLALGGAARADVVTWGPLSLADDNGGAFILTASSSQSGSKNRVLDLLLPDYSVSNFNSFLANQVAMAITASYDSGNIIGFGYEIFGMFDVTDPGSMASFNFNSGAASGTITASTSGAFSLATAKSQNLSAIFNLAELGGFTSITEVRLTASLVPEPSSMALSAAALLALLAAGRRTARRRTGAAALLALGALVGIGAGGPSPAQAAGTVPAKKAPSLMSPMGALAKAAAAKIATAVQTGQRGTFTVNLNAADGGNPGDECDDCNSDPDFTFPGGGGNAEIRVAVDPTGQKIIIGFNDARGFSISPVSLSGIARSSDGGLTWVDGGRLPNGSTTTISGTLYPQIFGDPDVKWVPGGSGCNFVYSSIMVKAISATGTAQTMSLHKTTDCGVTWAGPIEVTPATNPTGVLNGANARDAADKEFVDVDLDTGRILLSWTNFTVGQEIRTTYSDNIFTAAPTWSPSVIVAPTSGAGGTVSVQASMPRFVANGSPNAYLVWEQFVAATDPSGYNKYNVGFSRSTDNGATWTAPVSLTTDFQQPDQILGNDRVHSFPSIAVDNSGGANNGNIYVVYMVNSGGADGGDVFMQRSTDGGLTFGPRVSLSPRPGNDRSQWFPAIAVDKQSGRVSVIYYDQSASATGDVTQMTWVYSDTGGATWSTPSRVCAPPTTSADPTNACDRAFHAGYGNDTGQPNLGDYIGVDALLGSAYASFAGTPKIVNYTDGQPAGNMTTPEVRFKKLTTAGPALDIGSITFTETGGNGLIDAGDTVQMTVPLNNFVTNPVTNPVTYTGVTGTLTTTTPLVTILRSTVAYPNIAAGATASNSLTYVFQVNPGFTPGTPIDFKLAVNTAQGAGSMVFYRNTGTPVATTIFSENFNGVAPGSLPGGWTASHAGGSNTVPWTTSSTFCSPGSNALFHINANDAANPTRFERAFSPLIAVPAGAAYVTLEFDVCYDTEDDPSYNVLAYDGLMLRITDQTAGRTLRSVLTEAYAEEFTTGTANHLPKHLPRNSSTSYLQDLSAWAGFSNGIKPVKMRLPGMQGSTVQMRWEYTQDGGGICSDIRPGHSCGVMVDNIVMKSVTLKSDELATLSLAPVGGSPGTYNAVVKAQPIAGTGGITVNLTSSNPGITTMPANVSIAAGSQVSAPFLVTISPAASGTSVTITATGPSNARTAGIRLP